MLEIIVLWESPERQSERVRSLLRKSHWLFARSKGERGRGSNEPKPDISSHSSLFCANVARLLLVRTTWNKIVSSFNFARITTKRVCAMNRRVVRARVILVQCCTSWNTGVIVSPFHTLSCMSNKKKRLRKMKRRWHSLVITLLGSVVLRRYQCVFGDSHPVESSLFAFRIFAEPTHTLFFTSVSSHENIT